MAHASGSVSVLPTLPAYADARAKQLGLGRHELVAILINNYLHGPPMGLPPHENVGGEWKRVTMQLSLPVAVRRNGTRAGRRWKLSFSGLVESLLIADVMSGPDTLTIHPVAGATKPECELPP